jgi:nucleoside-diphosphate-sugar epimerase
MKNKQKQTILVTGGAGFIGSNLVKKLVRDGYKVKVIDNLSTGKKQNLKEVMAKIEFIKGDLLNLKLLEKATRGVDYIFHVAAIASVQRSLDNPVWSFTNNANATLNVLMTAKKNKVKKVIYSASSSMYGNSQKKEKDEELIPQPLSVYAAGKLTGEYLMKCFSVCFGLSTVCLRYFNVFGPNQDPNSAYSAVIPLFIKSILKNKRPVIYGDGKQSRDFTYVDNVVAANILAMKAKKIKNGESINIALNKNHSLLELLEIINKKLNKKIKPIFKPARKGDVKHSLASIKKAKELINYQPKISFEKGIEKTIDYYKKIV